MPTAMMAGNQLKHQVEPPLAHLELLDIGEEHTRYRFGGQQASCGDGFSERPFRCLEDEPNDAAKTENFLANTKGKMS